MRIETTIDGRTIVCDTDPDKISAFWWSRDQRVSIMLANGRAEMVALRDALARAIDESDRLAAAQPVLGAALADSFPAYGPNEHARAAAKIEAVRYYVFLESIGEYRYRGAGDSADLTGIQSNDYKTYAEFTTYDDAHECAARYARLFTGRPYVTTAPPGSVEGPPPRCEPPDSHPDLPHCTDPRYRETGEVREPVEGDWFVSKDTGRPLRQGTPVAPWPPRRILRPVEAEEPEPVYLDADGPHEAAPDGDASGGN